MIEIGSRATYRDERWVVVAPADFLDGRRWWLQRRSGGTLTGWCGCVAPEEALDDVETPGFEIGDNVRVGAIGWSGTITAITGRLYAVEGPDALQEVGPDWERHRVSVNHGPRRATVGAESLNLDERI